MFARCCELAPFVAWRPRHLYNSGMRASRYNSEARQRLAAPLDEAKRDGGVIIRRRDGQAFTIKPVQESLSSPLDVAGINLGLTRAEILQAIREGRKHK